MVNRLQTITDKESQSLSKYTGNALYKGLLSALAEVQLANQAARKYVIISGNKTMLKFIICQTDLQVYQLC